MNSSKCSPSLNGKAKKENLSAKDVSLGELIMGQKVEMEHTDNPSVAKAIAMDHLSELPDYYTRLKKMEEKK